MNFMGNMDINAIGGKKDSLYNDNIEKARKVRKDDIEHNNKKVSEIELQRVIERINHAMKIFNKRLRVKLKVKDKRVILAKIIDNSTEELLREVPINKVFELDKRLQEEIGIFLDETI